MKALYFDCFSGISGDMTLGSLLDLGIDAEIFKSELNKLNLDGYKIVISKKSKNGIIGTDVDVVLHQSEEHVHHPSHHEHDEEHHHSNEHDHSDHEHSHQHPHNHCHSDHEHPHPHHSHQHTHESRNLLDIEKLIGQSEIKPWVKEFSKKVFREIAKAEAKVHNKSIEDVHFHEVGAVDSIVDIVGAAICLDILGVDKVFSSPLHDGHGFIKCQHGTIPVPVPAVMEMLAGSGIPLVPVDINTELVTPTGMGIIKCLSSKFGAMPAMSIDKIGYGMGKKDTGGFNALRVVLGTMDESIKSKDEIVVLETNIDDISSEILGYTMEALLENGALDVFHTPIYMKKSRPAVMLSVITSQEKEEKLAEIILKETTTLGVRRHTVARYCMDRNIIKIDTEYGAIRIKVASVGGVTKMSPEYEDCAAIARKHGIPIMKVFELAREKAAGANEE